MSGYAIGMTIRKKKITDINVLAASIVQATTQPEPSKKPVTEKNPAAVALGRLGGLKGGKARAERLSIEQRKTIASKAAHMRWEKKTKA